MGMEREEGKVVWRMDDTDEWSICSMATGKDSYHRRKTPYAWNEHGIVNHIACGVITHIDAKENTPTTPLPACAARPICRGNCVWRLPASHANTMDRGMDRMIESIWCIYECMVRVAYQCVVIVLFVVSFVLRLSCRFAHCISLAACALPTAGCVRVGRASAWPAPPEPQSRLACKTRLILFAAAGIRSSVAAQPRFLSLRPRGENDATRRRPTKIGPKQRAGIRRRQAQRLSLEKQRSQPPSQWQRRSGKSKATDESGYDEQA